jgi:hypothetical protein
LTGILQRIFIFRRNYLFRDRRRCVIFRQFELNKATERFKRDSDNVKDNNEYLLKNDDKESEILEIAYIFFHFLISFTTIGGDLQLI